MDIKFKRDASDSELDVVTQRYRDSIDDLETIRSHGQLDRDLYVFGRAAAQYENFLQCIGYRRGEGDEQLIGPLPLPPRIREVIRYIEQYVRKVVAMERELMRRDPEEKDFNIALQRLSMEADRYYAEYWGRRIVKDCLDWDALDTESADRLGRRDS